MIEIVADRLVAFRRAFQRRNVRAKRGIDVEQVVVDGFHNSGECTCRFRYGSQVEEGLFVYSMSFCLVGVAVVSVEYDHAVFRHEHLASGVGTLRQSFAGERVGLKHEKAVEPHFFRHSVAESGRVESDAVAAFRHSVDRDRQASANLAASENRLSGVFLCVAMPLVGEHHGMAFRDSPFVLAQRVRLGEEHRNDFRSAGCLYD